MTFGVNRRAWAGSSDLCGQGAVMDSLELPGAHSFPQLSNTEAFLLSKGLSSAAASQGLSPTLLQLYSTPLGGMVWSGQDGNGLFSSHSSWPTSSSCCCIPLFQPHLWSPALRSGAMVSPRCLQGAMVSQSLEKSMLCFPLLAFPGPSISLVSLQNLQQIIEIKFSL